MKIELVPVPVSDVDRALDFYANKLGFAVDVDVRPTEYSRFVQLTPPGSACSIALTEGVPFMTSDPGTLHGLHLVVADIAAARHELLESGADVGEVQDVGGSVLYASITDPDGNTVLLQQMPWRTGDQY